MNIITEIPFVIHIPALLKVWKIDINFLIPI